MKVFASVRMGISPKINALATLLVSAVSIAAVIGWYINARAEAAPARPAAGAAGQRLSTVCRQRRQHPAHGRRAQWGLPDGDPP
jgi:hypothetical protein